MFNVIHNCEKFGHIAKFCKAPKQVTSSVLPKKCCCENSHERKNSDKHSANVADKSNSSDASKKKRALNVSCDNSDHDQWILDSGAFYHMCCCRDLKTDYVEDGKNQILLGDNTVLTIYGRGSVNVVTLVDGVWVDAVIKDVRFIPGLKRNLFSEGVLTSKGMQIVKNSSSAEVFQDGILMLHAQKTVNALYHIEGTCSR